MKENPKARQWIRLIYLYLFASIGLVVTVIGCIRGINVGLKSTLFQQADVYPRPVMIEQQDKEMFEKEQLQYQQAEKIRTRDIELAGAISMMLVGIPLYFYHWRLIQQEQR